MARPFRKVDLRPINVSDELDDELYENFNNVLTSTELKPTGRTFKLKNQVNQKPLRVVEAQHLPYQQQVNMTVPPNNRTVRSRGLGSPTPPPPKVELQKPVNNPVYAVKVPPKPPSKAKVDEQEDEEDESYELCGIPLKNWCICCLILLLVVIIIILAADFNVQETVRSLASTPTAFPTNAPTMPTVSPTLGPTLSPTTRNPTVSPTISPSTSPTTSPTTTFDFISTVCLGSSQEFRTSLCVSDKHWVRCEKDGSVKPQDDGNYLRTCEIGDVCPCQSLHRVGISDPCVLKADADESESTCIGDGQ